MKPLKSATIAAPGFYGLNTQESSITLDSGFALEATNCIIDKFGRIGSRKGWTVLNETEFTGQVRALAEYTKTDGTLEVLYAANNKLWRLEDDGTSTELTALEATITGSTQANPCSITATAHELQTGDTVTITGVVGMTELNGNSYTITVVDDDTFTLDSTDSTGYTAYTSGGTATKDSITITDDDWQIVTFNNHAVFIQDGHEMVYYNGTNDHYYEYSSAADTTSPSSGAACFNRVWIAKNNTVYWSKILEPQSFSGTGTGFINVREVFGEDDDVTAITSYNNRLTIFGRRNIAMFSGGEDPTSGNFQMIDHIKGIGCIARDSVQNIGTDVVFLSGDGVRTLGRTIQEVSSPIGDVSKNIRDEIVQYAAGESTYRIKSVFSQENAFYLLSLPATQFTYCFDTRAKLQDGSLRVTKWTSINPTAFCVRKNEDVLLGQEGYVGKYNQYSDNGTAYRMQYYTNYFDFGSPVTESILKKIRLALIGATSQVGTLRWAFDYNTDYSSATFTLSSGVSFEYSVDEYGLGSTVVAGSQSADTITHEVYDESDVLTSSVHYTVDFSSTQTTTYDTAYTVYLDSDTYYYMTDTPTPSRTATTVYISSADINAEYSTGIVLDNISINLSGRGAVTQVGFEAEISSGSLSIQKLDIFAKDGKMIS